MCELDASLQANGDFIACPPPDYPPPPPPPEIYGLLSLAEQARWKHRIGTDKSCGDGFVDWGEKFFLDNLLDDIAHESVDSMSVDTHEEEVAPELPNFTLQFEPLPIDMEASGWLGTGTPTESTKDGSADEIPTCVWSPLSEKDENKGVVWNVSTEDAPDCSAEPFCYFVDHWEVPLPLHFADVDTPDQFMPDLDEEVITSSMSRRGEFEWKEGDVYYSGLDWYASCYPAWGGYMNMA